MDLLTLDNYRNYDLDDNVTGLVLALSGLGCITKSSCGGHLFARKGSGRRRRPDWFVAFVIPDGVLDPLLAALKPALATGGVKLGVEWSPLPDGWLYCDGSIYPPDKLQPHRVLEMMTNQNESGPLWWDNAHRGEADTSRPASYQGPPRIRD